MLEFGVESVVDAEAAFFAGALGEEGAGGVGGAGEEDFEVVEGELALAADLAGVGGLVVGEDGPDAPGAGEVVAELVADETDGDVGENTAFWRAEFLLLAHGEGRFSGLDFIPVCEEFFQEELDSTREAAGGGERKLQFEFLPKLGLFV